MILAFLTMTVNMRMLAFNASISYSIHYFVSLVVIVEFSKYYFDSLIENKVRVVMNKHPHNEKKGKDIVFSERSCFHKFARVLYKVLRTFYVSCVYYFLPFGIILMQWMAPGSY